MTAIRLEVWDRLGTAGFEKKIATLDTHSDSARLQPVNGIGEGRASMPDIFDRAGNILHTDPLNPANNVRSTIRAYLDGDVSGVDPPYVEWLPNQIVPPQDSESGRFEISGLGREGMVIDAIVMPFDWDGEQEFHSWWPDWIYGGKDIIGPVQVTFRPHLFRYWIDTGATGTADIDISFNGGAFVSVAVAPGDTSFDVEAAIEAAIPGIDADVTGMGTQQSPWQISLQSPDGDYVVALDSSGLTGGRAYQDLIQYGVLLPIGWTISQIGATTLPHGQVLEWGADAVGPVALPAGCDFWIFFRGQEYAFPGLQARRRVQENGYYYAPPIWLYAQGASALVRVVIRDINERLLAYEEINLAANTLTQTTGVWVGPAVISGGLIQIPDATHEIVYRIGHIGAGTPPPIWIACPSLTEGFAASTIGVVVGDLYEDWTTEHAASTFPLSYWVHGDGGFYLVPDFTDTLDSGGNAWQRTEKIVIKRGERFDKVLAKIVKLGYDWRIIGGPVDGYYLLQIFNAPDMGTDYSAANTPTVRGGRDVTKRSLRRWLAKPGTLVEGSGQNFALGAVTAAEAGWGVAYNYEVGLDYDEDTLAAAALVSASDHLRKTHSLVINLADTDTATTPIPGRAYVPGDTVRVLDPPLLPDEAERVWSVLYAQDEQGLTWEIQLGNNSFAG